MTHVVMDKYSCVCGCVGDEGYWHTHTKCSSLNDAYSYGQIQLPCCIPVKFLHCTKLLRDVNFWNTLKSNTEPLSCQAITWRPFPRSSAKGLAWQNKQQQHNVMVNANLKHNDRMGVNNLPSTEQAVKTQPKQDKSVSLIFHCFWPFICCF